MAAPKREIPRKESRLFANRSFLFLFLGVSGCLYEYPLNSEPRTDSDLDTDTGWETDTGLETDTGTETNTNTITNPETDKDTATDVGIETDTGPATNSDTNTFAGTDTDSETATPIDTNSDSETVGCPSGLNISSPVQFTEYIQSKSAGTEYIDSCPDGQVIIGFHGFVQDQITYLINGTIQAVCGSVSVSSVDGQCVVHTLTASSLPLRGTSGTVEWLSMCPAHQMIVGFKAKTGSDVDQLIFRCAPLFITRDGSGHTVTRGPVTVLSMVGGNGGGTDWPPADCPDGHIATQTKLQAEKYLQAIALGCQTPSLVY